MQQFQQRYVTFAALQGKRPEECCQGPQHEYIIWINRKWREWRKATGRRGDHMTPEDHADFDAWLQTIGGNNG